MDGTERGGSDRGSEYPSDGPNDNFWIHKPSLGILFTIFWNAMLIAIFVFFYFLTLPSQCFHIDNEIVGNPVVSDQFFFIPIKADDISLPIRSEMWLNYFSVFIK